MYMYTCAYLCIYLSVSVYLVPILHRVSIYMYMYMYIIYMYMEEVSLGVVGFLCRLNIHVHVRVYQNIKYTCIFLSH